MIQEASYATAFHAPVLCHTVLDVLVTDRSGLYVDATLGGGGHCCALLHTLDKAGRVIGVDRDEDAVAVSMQRLSAEIAGGRLRILHAAFGDLEDLMASEGVSRVDGILVDLGISSHQLDSSHRGFSYRLDGPLDMRMDARKGTRGLRMVNQWSASALRKLLKEYGEEPAASRIARAIVTARPLQTTLELARVVERAAAGRAATKALSRTFQAIRIAVNDELGQLEQILKAGERLVRSGGRMVVISYHSLEDRRVKRTFRYGNLRGDAVRDVFGTLLNPWRELTRRPLRPTPAEIAANPRARSARLRAAERCEPAVPGQQSTHASSLH